MQQQNISAARKLFEARGWIEWKEGNIDTARELYQRALTSSLSSGLGVLEQRVGNLSAAQRLLRASVTKIPKAMLRG